MTSIKFRALTHNDHKLFFEALGEYGKDFQNIQQYMAQKCGKSNSGKSSEQTKSIDPQERREQDKKEEDKKREQIRNFYNKLYGKLSQLIGRLDDRVEKVNQELYLLINYGEIWKKHGFKFNNKTKKLLEELVHQGYTTLRFKNKNVRLRTPPCKALKKINEIGIDEKVKVVTTRELPKDVIVEFHPRTNRDWLKVQSMAQNPLVRAKLSIQKRLFNILEFLENKWNVSQDKLNRTVDAWLKVPPNYQSLEDNQSQICPPSTSVPNGNFNNFNTKIEALTVSDSGNPTTSDQNHTTPVNDLHLRLRLRPSAKHELKEVNITRVVPDNHLDLSFNAYIKRFGESISKISESASKNNVNKDLFISSAHGTSNEGLNNSDHNLELSQGALSTSSRLPLSLTTPDSSILFEKSCTSDQPYNATAQKSINFLAKIVGSFGGCENSRTACEDTQDRSLQVSAQFGDNNHSTDAGERSVYFNGVDSTRTNNVLVNNSISALIDEDAAIEPALSTSQNQSHSDANALTKQNSDSQNSKSVDFNIPKNVLLGDWFKMSGQDGGDNANDAFPPAQTDDASDNNKTIVDTHTDDKEEEANDLGMTKNDSCNNGSRFRPQNHMIEIQKLAEGWIKQDESSMTVGELYLAFKCPEKIILEYEFEQFTYSNYNDQLKTDCSDNVLEKPEQPVIGTTIVPESPANNTLIFKLLTAASLSLAQIERQKLEQQHKLHDQPGAKLKRRKGPSNPNTIKYLKRDEISGNSNLKASTSGQQTEFHINSNNHLSNNHVLYNNNYMSTSTDKNQSQVMTLHDIETTNQRVEEALKQLQPTRLSVFRRAR